MTAMRHCPQASSAWNLVALPLAAALFAGLAAGCGRGDDGGDDAFRARIERDVVQLAGPETFDAAREQAREATSSLWPAPRVDADAPPASPPATF